jgi:hypothetical protein
LRVQLESGIALLCCGFVVWSSGAETHDALFAHPGARTEMWSSRYRRGCLWFCKTSRSFSTLCSLIKTSVWLEWHPTCWFKALVISRGPENQHKARTEGLNSARCGTALGSKWCAPQKCCWVGGDHSAVDPDNCVDHTTRGLWVTAVKNFPVWRGAAAPPKWQNLTHFLRTDNEIWSKYYNELWEATPLYVLTSLSCLKISSCN